MKATKAYIASLGTTGVLLAASLLMLAVVSAVVAFDAWPGGSIQSPARGLVLTDRAPAIRVSATANGPSATAPTRAAAGGVPTAAVRPRTTFNGGGVAGERFAATPGAGAPATGGPLQGVPKAPDVPQVPSADNVIDSISNPATTTSQIADGTQAVTDAAGVSVGGVSPDAGNAVTDTGQQVSQTIREIPLPDHVIPGY